MFDERFWLPIISGEQRGFAAALLRGLLWSLTPLYGLGMRLRNLAFNQGWKKSSPAPLCVISIGNLTTGGTGKSPLVIWLAGQLRARGRRVCVLSRGYKGAKAGVNDESRELAERLPDVPQLVDANRAASAEIASAELEMEVALLDDGFQHRQLRRDLDLVLVDATEPFGYGYLLPRGLLREPVSSLRRADWLIITRANQVQPQQLAALRQTLERYCPAHRVAATQTVPTRLLQADGRSIPLEQLRGKSIYAFCGVGNSAAFFGTAAALGSSIAGKRAFPDHHAYTAEELAALGEAGRSSKAEALVCSHKDLVKIGRCQLGEIPLYAILIEVQFLEGERELIGAVEAVSKQSIAAGTTGV